MKKIDYKKRIQNFSVEDLQDCYILYDTYWDDGLNDEATLRLIKSKLLGIELDS